MDPVRRTEGRRISVTPHLRMGQPRCLSFLQKSTVLVSSPCTYAVLVGRLTGLRSISRSHATPRCRSMGCADADISGCSNNVNESSVNVDLDEMSARGRLRFSSGGRASCLRDALLSRRPTISSSIGKVCLAVEVHRHAVGK